MLIGHTVALEVARSGAGDADKLVPLITAMLRAEAISPREIGVQL